MTNIHISIHTKTLNSIHRGNPSTIHYTCSSGHHTQTLWTNPELNVWWDWQSKRIYTALGHIHMLQPDWVIRHQHWARGLVGLIPHVTNHSIHHSIWPPLPKHSLQPRTDTWTTRVVHWILSISPLSHPSLLITIASITFKSTCPHDTYMYK